MPDQALATKTDPLSEFQKRISEKLRDDIGNMMPDEVLKEMVNRALEEQFFKAILPTRDQWGRENAGTGKTVVVCSGSY